MRNIFFLFIFVLILKGDEFISAKEYAKALYNNPRGISCKACHGEDGEKRVLSFYIKNGKKTPFIIPAINKLSFKEFCKMMARQKGVRSIMPNYSLTKGEIAALYYYLQNQRKKNEKK